jgi:hypothetical protein
MPSGGSIPYPFRPYVEARMTVPAAWVVSDTAPALPPGIHINILTLADLAATTEPDGVVMAPPAGLAYTCGAPDYPDLKMMPWTLWAKQVECVCAGGTFAKDYADNGAAVSCP